MLCKTEILLSFVSEVDKNACHSEAKGEGWRWNLKLEVKGVAGLQYKVYCFEISQILSL